ncbi:fimbrial protein [Cronobacter dublinensis]|uniref:Type 1 fimbrial protein n=1 Tax=Cronobacter dublinensis TaxID=413497 RepID=A0A9Q4T2E9_9ENTR|nr:fimbrial protein [Cronobacter dublinensis]NCH88971.1 type 1 fimbrial protein [Cronobacter dublinensis]NHV91130.1 fimbrial protein [Cronobacter dublinensis]
MKKIVLAALMPSLFMVTFSGQAAPNKVTVAGGNINFEGAVVAAPCAVDNSSDGQTVRLGQVPTNRLSAKGNTSTAVPFNIKLTGCDLASVDPADKDKTVSYTSASVIFSGATVGDDSTLAVQSGGSAGGASAQNVGIQIFQNNQAVKVDGSTATSAQKLINGNNEIPFSAAYVATADGVVAGAANSIVNFQVSYE